MPSEWIVTPAKLSSATRSNLPGGNLGLWITVEEPDSSRPIFELELDAEQLGALLIGKSAVSARLTVWSHSEDKKGETP